MKIWRIAFAIGMLCALLGASSPVAADGPRVASADLESLVLTAEDLGPGWVQMGAQRERPGPLGEVFAMSYHHDGDPAPRSLQITLMTSAVPSEVVLEGVRLSASLNGAVFIPGPAIGDGASYQGMLPAFVGPATVMYLYRVGTVVVMVLWLADSWISGNGPPDTSELAPILEAEALGIALLQADRIRISPPPPVDPPVLPTTPVMRVR